MAYGQQYWIDKGMTPEDALLRSQGKARCAMCDAVLCLVDSKAKGRPICSDHCRDAAKAQRIARYRDTVACRGRCSICGSPMSKKMSLHQKEYVCSEACNQVRRSRLPPKRTITSRSYWIERGYTDEDAAERVAAYQRQRSKRCVEYWTSRGHAMEDAVAKIGEMQKNVASANTMSKAERRRKSVRCVEYWLMKGLSPDEAKAQVRRVNDNHSLESLVRKHGDVEGKRIYEEYCARRKREYTLNFYEQKYGKEEGLARWLRRYEGRSQASKYACDVFKEAFDRSSPEVRAINWYFSGHSRREFGMRLPSGRYAFYDCVIPDLRLCIEINGAFWHADPLKYRPGDTIKIGCKDILVDEIWARDREKLETMIARGYRFVVMWNRKRSDLKDHVERCLKAIAEQESILLGRDDQ